MTLAARLEGTEPSSPKMAQCSGGADRNYLSLLYIHTAREWTSLHRVPSGLENYSLTGINKR